MNAILEKIAVENEKLRAENDFLRTILEISTEKEENS